MLQMGLTPREYNEFIVCCLPLLQDNPYNIISFQTDVYTDAAKLQIDPAPDTLIRVFMTWKGCESFVQLPAQELTAPERTGFTVVEWGGTEVKESRCHTRQVLIMKGCTVGWNNDINSAGISSSATILPAFREFIMAVLLTISPM